MLLTCVACACANSRLKVLKDVNWTIREGDKWHLQGANGARDLQSICQISLRTFSGSGKTTLLSLLTGDHPQSYTQANLTLFSLPRRKQPTSSLQRLVGTASPELYAAFPRRLGANALTVRDAIATGFESTFSYRPRTAAMDARIDELLDALGPRAWGSEGEACGFGERPFAALAPGEQSVVLLLRALVGRPPLLILDEVFAGMDNRMISIAKEYLRTALDRKQAVIFVTHWEEEVPWDSRMTRNIRLESGTASIS